MPDIFDHRGGATRLFFCCAARKAEYFYDMALSWSGDRSYNLSPQEVPPDADY